MAFGTKQDSMASSRHNPDFMDRTFPQRLEIEDRINAFRQMVADVVESQDEARFEECLRRARGLYGEAGKAGERGAR